MSECEQYEPTIQAYVAGELDAAGLGPALIHSRTCEACRQLLELHRDLAGLASHTAAASAADLDRVQARVLRQASRGTRGARGGMATRWAPAWSTQIRVLAAVATALLLFLAGLSAGRARPERGTQHTPREMTNFLLTAIGADAAANHALRDVEGSRFTYSNVAFRRADGNRVALDFDLTTHVQAVEAIESPLVQEALAQSLLNPSSTGARLKAMSYASGAMAPKVREALVFALHHDANLAVRLEALTILSDHLSEPKIEEAVLETLRDDEAVQMRLLALEYLADHSVDRDRIREVIRERARPGDEALIVRLAQYDGHS